ncbi:uncharacterized protein LACBIDRAFT_299535 [Laccaria bicolor S238N-H82]|uniref:Predicted protein n=1 Tax=Laccaria bicolor (strain S238N-H82 / ATCC MYA-4686) TaxID=486041 RepID=B0E3R3_LACBS|nr:uncharacterized protein LACBIDRAFT_299535 [Laccaria bicolor S238N-H82]EDQ98516.1 predicted protein [Laccaria bicolor S238N-H82]|eukprot:XP_001890831.1 predicted protein [Laccaria bicolor S238N-H82]
MVPGIQYSRGLTLIVGQPLPLASEEDAFWIFISVTPSWIRTRLRPYFRIDKILVDMGMNPTSTSICVCTLAFFSFRRTLLPYLNRICDLFLHEGTRPIPFILPYDAIPTPRMNDWWLPLL